MYVMTIFLSFINSSDVLWQKTRSDISIKQKQNLRITKVSLILKTALIHGLNTFLGVTLSGFTSDKSLRLTNARYSLYTIYIGLQEYHLCNNTTLSFTLSRLYWVLCLRPVVILPCSWHPLGLQTLHVPSLQT